MSVWFPIGAFKLTSGTLAFWKTTGESGQEKLCAFCSDCGSRIYHASPDEADTLSVKGGSLDDIRKIAPIAHIWTRSAQPWVLRFIAEETCYETEPESFDQLIAQFEVD